MKTSNILQKKYFISFHLLKILRENTTAVFNYSYSVILAYFYQFQSILVNSY